MSLIFDRENWKGGRYLLVALVSLVAVIIGFGHFVEFALDVHLRLAKLDWPTFHDPLPPEVEAAVARTGGWAGEALVHVDGPSEHWRIETELPVVEDLFARVRLDEPEQSWVETCDGFPDDFHARSPVWWEPPTCTGCRVLSSTSFHYLLLDYEPMRAYAFLYDPTERVLWAWVGSR